MKATAIFLLMILATTATADSDRFTLRVDDEPLADVWQLVENFCKAEAHAKTARPRHPDAHVNVHLEQVNCAEAYQKLRELDDGAEQ